MLVESVGAVERCLACEADSVGTPEGSRFYPDPVCALILETPRLPNGRGRARGSRERLLTPLQPTAIDFVSYPMQHDKAKPHRGTFPGAAC